MAEQNELARTEFFSDGVMAIAATLLVLEIKVPQVDGAATAYGAWVQLGRLWPSYLAFTLSFGMILVIWVNHHYTMRLLHGISKHFLYANGLLLFSITLLPFPSGVLAAYINTAHAAAGVALYGLASMFINIAWAVWWAAMSKPVRLFKPEVAPKYIAAMVANIRLGIGLYAAATLLSLWSPSLGLLLIMALNLLWVAISISEKAHRGKKHRLFALVRRPVKKR